MRFVKITGPDLCNGVGNRCTLWVAGCTHNCPNCHNKWLQDYSKGEPLDSCKDKLTSLLNLPYIKGLTVSGGDPLDQNEESLAELCDLLKWVKENFKGKDIWIYTGYKLDELLNKKNETITNILGLCDYIVDGLFIEKLKDVTIAFRGSSNQIIWHNVNNMFTKVNDEVFKN